MHHSPTFLIRVLNLQVVEIVMTGIEDAFGVDHPMHIHGYSFRLVGGGKIPLGSTLQDLVLLDEQGL